MLIMLMISYTMLSLQTLNVKILVSDKGHMRVARAIFPSPSGPVGCLSVEVDKDSNSLQWAAKASQYFDPPPTWHLRSALAPTKK